MRTIRLTATFRGRRRRGNYLLTDVQGDLNRSHAWLNSIHNDLPPGIPYGARIRFWASPHSYHGELKLSDVREVVVLEGVL